MKTDSFHLLGQRARLGRYRAGAARALARLKQQDFVRRLWERDASLWSSAPAVQEKIRNRLGWLLAPENFQRERERIQEFVRAVQRAGFTHAVLLGMGGSSMCPEVCRTTYGVAPGFLDLRVLDTTDPATIQTCEQVVALGRTLFIVSSKSGTTTETISLYKYFYERVRAVKGEAAGENFIAITDAGTPLARQAAERRFRDCFLNPADIGGRFSALSFFGLVPAALMGMDISVFLSRAQEMARACRAATPLEENPGVVLGVILGHLYSQRRDKLTFVLDPTIASFGYWVEQLIAENLGKLGKGIVPVEGEPLGSPRVYAPDRVFVSLSLHGRRVPARLNQLETAGHPLIQITLRDKFDLATEFFRWEVASAVAGALMQINPFDEPNVQESKDNTERLLRDYRASGRLPEPPVLLAEKHLRASVPAGLGSKLRSRSGQNGLAALIGRFLALAKARDYIGLMAYLEASPATHRRLQALRLALRDRLHRAVTLGYGPRFLHSTGQLHKGGPNNGLYFQLVATDAVDVPVPGEPNSFSVLKQAQALGDFGALGNKQRRVLRLHLGDNIAAGLQQLAVAFRRALALQGRQTRRPHRPSAKRRKR